MSEPPRVNKLHEWGLAVLIVALLAGILAVFLAFFRSVR